MLSYKVLLSFGSWRNCWLTINENCETQSGRILLESLPSPWKFQESLASDLCVSKLPLQLTWSIPRLLFMFSWNSKKLIWCVILAINEIWGWKGSWKYQIVAGLNTAFFLALASTLPRTCAKSPFSTGPQLYALLAPTKERSLENRKPTMATHWIIWQRH